MSLSIISQRYVALYDVSTKTTDQSVLRLIKKYSVKERSKITRGNPYCEYCAYN